MVFNGTDWTVVSTGLGVVLAVGTWIQKRFPKAAQAVENGVATVLPKEAVAVAEDAFEFVKHIEQSPFFAGKVAAGELKAKHVLDELTQTKAVSEAKTILMQLGKAYTALSTEEQVKAQSVLKLGLLKLGINMNDTQILDVFHLADEASKALASDKTFSTLFEQSA